MTPSQVLAPPSVTVLLPVESIKVFFFLKNKKKKKPETDINIVHAAITAATESHTLGLQIKSNEHLARVDMATQRGIESKPAVLMAKASVKCFITCSVVCLSSADTMTSVKERLPA